MIHNSWRKAIMGEDLYNRWEAVTKKLSELNNEQAQTLIFDTIMAHPFDIKAQVEDMEQRVKEFS